MKIIDIRKECEKEKLIRLHRQLWRCIARDIASTWSRIKIISISNKYIDCGIIQELKLYYSQKLYKHEFVRNNCFACQYACIVSERVYKGNDRASVNCCRFCPFYWDYDKTKTKCCVGCTSIYEDRTKYDMLYELFPIETDEDMKKVVKMCCRIAELQVNDGRFIYIDGVIYKY